MAHTQTPKHSYTHTDTLLSSHQLYRRTSFGFFHIHHHHYCIHVFVHVIHSSTRILNFCSYFKTFSNTLDFLFAVTEKIFFVDNFILVTFTIHYNNYNHEVKYFILFTYILLNAQGILYTLKPFLLAFQYGRGTFTASSGTVR